MVAPAFNPSRGRAGRSEFEVNMVLLLTFCTAKVIRPSQKTKDYVEQLTKRFVPRGEVNMCGSQKTHYGVSSLLLPLNEHKRWNSSCRGFFFFFFCGLNPTNPHNEI